MIDVRTDARLLCRGVRRWFASVWYRLLYGNCPGLSRPMRVYLWAFVGREWVQWFKGRLREEPRVVCTRRYAREHLVRQIDLARRASARRYSERGFEGASMPMYSFRCPHCGNTFDVVLGMNDKHDTFPCGCGNAAKRDFQAERPNALGTEKGDTFWSQSLAINPDQTAEHRRLFPNVRVREDGCLGFDSHREREKYLETTGFEKVPGKQRRPSKKLTPVATRAT